MVALAPITNETSTWDVLDAFPKLHSRAREAKTTPCTEVPMHKSRSRIEIWLTIYETCDRLESFTRDPIGYSDGVHLYLYVWGTPLAAFDPSGLCGKCDGFLMTPIKRRSCELFKDASGNWNAGHQFDNDILFDGTCSCCRFRQMVLESNIKLTFIKPDGTSQVISHAVDNGSVEDCTRDASGRIVFCYGDPNQKVSSPDSVFSPDGCYYHMADAPGFEIKEIIRSLLLAGHSFPLHVKLEMSITFGLKVEDVCNGGVIPPTRELSFGDCEAHKGDTALWRVFFPHCLRHVC